MTNHNETLKKGKATWLITLFAVVLFVVMFINKQAGVLDFWYWMSANLVVVISLAFLTDRENLSLLKQDIAEKPFKKILLGLGFAFILFVVFYVGNILIRFILEKAGEGIQNVYSFKQDAPPWRIVLLMALIIGPGEEIFWRGYLQRKMSLYFGANKGFIFATFLYTVVHVFTGNMVLVLAALICGIFWGFLYKKYGSMTINMVSHTVWDIVVFIIMPFN
jgi:membrane protease YdiL (CAAX protease family)